MPDASLFPLVSAYQEYDELQELRAEDHRRRAAKADQVHRMFLTAVAQAFYEDEARRLATRISNAEACAAACRPNARRPWNGEARWYRRALTRIAGRYDAKARRARRELTALKPPGYHPVIKKGLTR